jgi:hypothetical protein
MIACQKGNRDMVELLLSREAVQGVPPRHDQHHMPE